jgi:glutathione S-transferase
MSKLAILIGNKNYSSWSLRPWLALAQSGLPFEETVVALYRPDTAAQIRPWSPSGKVPVLRHEGRTIWDSLAICEYLAETFPEKQLWPRDPGARALARSVCAEMHSGFPHLRSQMPMNIRAAGRKVSTTPELGSDVARVSTIWRDCREKAGSSGPFLFGAFSIADAMYAPVVTRFATYGVTLGPIERTYCEAVLALPAMRDWAAAAAKETEVIASSEVGR